MDSTPDASNLPTDASLPSPGQSEEANAADNPAANVTPKSDSAKKPAGASAPANVDAAAPADAADPAPAEAGAAKRVAPQAQQPPQAEPKPTPPALDGIELGELDSSDLDAAVAEAMEGITESELDAAASAADGVTDDFAPGTLVQGRIANIGSEDVLIDFGAKALGAMPKGELPGETTAIGDAIEVCILQEDRQTGLLRVSHKEARRKAMLRDMKVGLMIEGRISGMNKGGLDLDADGLRAFIPASQVDLHFMKDISDLIGQTVRVEVIKFDRESGDVVVSRRKAMMIEREEQKEKTFAELSVGDVRRGIVRSLVQYGAFVDIGGIDGLLHVSDMSWGRVDKPESIVKIGDELDVKILKLSSEQKKVSLGLKQVKANPWETVGDKYVVGAKLKGRVVRLASFGAFVELEPGVDGLLPLSEMSWTRRVHNASQIVKEGDIVEVGVAGVDAEKRRISLSLKQISEDPWAGVVEKYAVGSKIKGKVVRTTDFGAFVALADGIDGLIHISELDDSRVKAVTDKVKPDQEVEVRVLGVDAENKRISLSMRKPPPEPTAEERAATQAAAKAAAAKRASSEKRRGGITLGWEVQGLGQLDPSKFAP